MTPNTKKVIIILAVAAVITGAVSLIFRLTSPSDADRLNDQIGAIADLPYVTQDNDNGEISINRGTASEDGSTENEPEESTSPVNNEEYTITPEKDSDKKPVSTSATTKAATTTKRNPETESPVVDEKPDVAIPVVTTSTAATTTQKPVDTTPPAEQPASNGYPDNPASGDEYVDENGQTWIYNGIARRWIEGGPTIVETAPDFTPSGNVILS